MRNRAQEANALLSGSGSADRHVVHQGLLVLRSDAKGLELRLPAGALVNSHLGPLCAALGSVAFVQTGTRHRKAEESFARPGVGDVLFAIGV